MLFATADRLRDYPAIVQRGMKIQFACERHQQLQQAQEAYQMEM